MQDTANKNRVKRIRGLVVAGVVVLFLIILATSSFTTIQSGSVGVVSVFGAIKAEPLEKGLHFITPLSPRDEGRRHDAKGRSHLCRRLEGSSDDQYDDRSSTTMSMN
jgi:regulator of protease activity HflC (stomatin/prohibitin superfamily)